MVATAEERRVIDLIEAPLEAMGFDLVRVKLMGSTRRTLQIMAEPLAERAMTVEDCVEVTDAISPILDVEDPIKSAYSLEVSSPGIDRPLTKPAHFARYAGFEAKLSTTEPIDGRKRYRGPMKGMADGAVVIEIDGTDRRVPFEMVDEAKLVMTDDLLAAHMDAAED